ncbi:Kelch repeat-containing protein [Cystobacter ferrugineus]|uniref:PKD domain-containing protein n=1 Tax=Cystobacter ferrugineus TaxID=83449 RepID=A0A1L9B4W5_9BACT|nr:kelch repeat-containing protein [Cystobacter ferrugineus]OJH37298.1 hypothetical protein BON30_28775 [Cystobacter ferrugineus]
MKRHLHQRMLWLVSCLLLAAMGCTQNPESQEPAGDVQFVNSVPQALTGDNVTRVVVTLNAPDLAARSISLTRIEGAWSGTMYRIPAGPNRTFTAEAFDATGVLRFRGEATGVPIAEGSTQVVALTLQTVASNGDVFDNTAPCIDSLIASASQVLPGGSVSLSATVHDPDPTDTLTYSWSATAGSFSTSTSTSTTWTAPATAGDITVTLTVTDSRGASSSISVVITVIDTTPGSGHGNAEVRVSFNSSPTVQRITTSHSPVAVGGTATLTVTAVDAEAHSLSYAWSSTCPGTWTDSNLATAQFTPSAAPAGDPCGNCPVTVIVTDSAGGSTPGTLRLCVGSGPVASFPPRIVLTHQSASSVLGGGSAVLRVVAEDGDGSALSFSWAASAGTLGAHVNSLSSSEVVWTAPTCSPVGGPPSITATVTNTRGFTASHTFYVPVVSGADCGTGNGDGGTGHGDGGTGNGDGGTDPSTPGTVALWTPTGHLLAGRYFQSATLLPSGKVLVIGGYSNTYPLASAELYDPATGSWSSARNMTQARALHSVTLLPSGKVLVIGGNSSRDGYSVVGLNSVEIYDPATNTWSLAAPMTFARYSHTATRLPNGKVLVIGGASPSSGGAIPELYDPATNSWLPLASMNSGSRFGHFAFLQSSGNVLVLGGGTPAVERYDPSLDSWTIATGFTGSWNYAQLLASGRVLLASGSGFSLYDPVLYTQTPVGNLIQTRSYLAVTRLNSGKLLVTGGNSSTSILSELFDPSTGLSAYTTSMPEGRHAHTATLLPNGKVLVTGGYPALTSSVLYTP